VLARYRYLRAIGRQHGSDEARVLAAMRNMRFAFLLVERRHPAAGLIVSDLVRNTELWLVDEGLETSLPVGSLHATRYFTPESFAMTAGVGMPVDPDLVRDALKLLPQHLRDKPLINAMDDRRCAEAIYRVALAEGVVDQVRYPSSPGSDDVD
jgi:hypothetical protein